MEIFILEDQLEKVVNPKTKEYLKEVVSCYRDGNYRASIVVLYTTLIFDLMEKLITLKDVYYDKNAENIYEKIKQQQKNNPFDPKWESDLINYMCKNMHIISAVEKEELEHLKKERNYAAHPIVSENEELALKPIRKETAADLIRKAFEIVFLRDAILARDINIELTEDLKNYYSRVGEDEFEKYLYNRYLNRMTQARKNELFKFLWQSVFIWGDKDEDCSRNRESNLLGLIYLYRGYKKDFQKIIKDNEDRLLNKIEVETFSSWCVSNGYTGTDYLEIVEFSHTSRIMNFIKFVESNLEIYSCFSDKVKGFIKATVENMYVKKNTQAENIMLEQEQIKLKAIAIFLTDDISKNFDSLIKYKREIYLHEKDLDIMLRQAEFYGYEKAFRKFLIDYCTEAYSFNDANRSFMYIELCKDSYEKDDYHYMLIKMNGNSQIYDNYNKDYFITQLETMYKNMFDDKLVSTYEERFLYSNLFGVVNTGYNIEKVLDLIEKRVHLYDKNGLTVIFCKIKERKTQNIALVQKDKKDYPNILSALEGMDKTVLYEFEEIFTNK